MSKKRDPVLAVLHYFETAELTLAQQALVLAQATLKRRAPRPAPAQVRQLRSRATKASAPVVDAAEATS